MDTPIIDLLAQIAHAIDTNDPAALFDATKDLGERIGMPAAVALARALVDDARTMSLLAAGTDGRQVVTCA